MRRERRGAALMLVLWLVVALGAIGSVVVRDSRGAAALALNTRAQVIARYAAESGLEDLVATVEDSLRALPFGLERRAWLNALEGATASRDTVVLGDGRFASVALDVTSRLDVNAAPLAALSTFFAQFTSPSLAAGVAQAIRAHVSGSGESGAVGSAASPFASPLRSVGELRVRGLVPDDILVRSANYLTVDGDGTINHRGAPEAVLVAATGELRDEPGRLLLVSRGWMGGHPLTHEIEAVFDIQVDRLVLVHWRERTL